MKKNHRECLEVVQFKVVKHTLLVRKNKIFTPSVNGTIIPNHEIGTGSRLRGMNNEVQDGQRSGGGNQLVQTVMSSEQNANNTYNMQSSSKRTANSDPTLFKTAMVVPL